jgi:hypothetical protein
LCCCAVAELEAQLGIAEKTLAEFIIDVAKGSRNVDGFKKVSKGVCFCRDQSTIAATAARPDSITIAAGMRCLLTVSDNMHIRPHPT